MNRRQFFSLFLCNLIPWWVGSGLMPLLPLYAARLGASPAFVGNYLSFIYLSLATGTVAGGWLSTKVRRCRELVILMGLLGAPATWLMGQVTSIWQLILLNAAVWFVAGITLALVAITAGQSAARNERGRIFGLLAVTTSLGGVLGGPTGLIADRWGYATLFALVACAWFLQIGAALFLRNGGNAAVPAQTGRAGTLPAKWGSAFPLLLLAALLYATGGFVGSLGRSLAMDAQGFPAAAITLTAALGSGTGMIVNPLLGRLSDRVNRRFLLCLIYTAGAFSLVLMAVATSLAAFFMVGMLTALSGAERAVSSALVTDLLPTQWLNRGLSLFDAVKWIGGVLGFAGTGYAVQFLGLSQTLVISTALPALAIVLLLYLYWHEVDTARSVVPRVNAGSARPFQN